LSQTSFRYRSRIPVVHTGLSFLCFSCAIFICILFFASGCEKKQTSVVDSIGFPPALASVAITPDSINLTSIPSGQSTVSFIITARVTHPDGPSHIAQVVYSFSAEGGAEPIATGTLLDNGAPPDLIQGDGIFSGQNSVAIQSLLVGKYYCQVSAQDLRGYASNADMSPVIISQVNYPPVISNLQAPNTITLGGQTQQFKLMVKAADSNGEADISKVLFNSFKPDGSAASGNPFLMYDDGSQNIIIPPNFTSGDAVKGDSIYTLTVIISPTDSQGNPTAVGAYRFEFQAVDRSNASSQKIVHTIEVVR
jgi:hypothetical protein